MRPTYQIEMQESDQQEVSSSNEIHKISNPYTSMSKYSPHAIYSSLSQHWQQRQNLEHYSLTENNPKS